MRPRVILGLGRSWMRIGSHGSAASFAIASQALRAQAKNRSANCNFVEVDENFRAYGLFSHRHTPEVTEHLGLSLEDMMFTTHLLPVARGILSTLYVWLRDAQQAADVESLYRQFYAGQPMVRIWPAGKLPELQHVANTNFCDIGFALDDTGRRLTVMRLS